MRILILLLIACAGLSAQDITLLPGPSIPSSGPLPYGYIHDGPGVDWIGGDINIADISGNVLITREELDRLLTLRDEEIRKLRRALELVRELRAIEAELRHLEMELFGKEN